jgi:hypothetical protein
MPAGLAVALAGSQGAAANRAHLLYDFIRRAYDSPSPGGTVGPAPAVQALLARVEHPGTGAPDRANGTNGGGDSRLDAVPIPLPVNVWVDTVFGGRATPDTVLTGILRSRDAALFYHGLFWLDDGTREWLAGEPALISFIVGTSAARFTLVAPAFRVSGRSVRPPGGDAALAAWESLVGARADAPAEFLKALLARDSGRLAYFFGAMGQLSDAQLRFGLDLGADRERRVDAAGRLYRAFERLAYRWVVDRSPFWRPTLDPALLLVDLAAGEAGTPRVPGTVGFWQQVFASTEPSRVPAKQPDVRTLAEGEAIDFPTLCALLSGRGEPFYQVAHRQVLLASRIVGHVTSGSARDAVDAIRAAGSQPALTGTLERAGVSDVAVFARASRRAAEISRIDDGDRAKRTLQQFQGALFVLARAVLRGSLPRAAFEHAVESLVAIPLGAGGDYEGRLVPWLAGVLDRAPARVPVATASTPGSACEDPFGGTLDEASLDVRLLRLLAGEGLSCPTVEWEGTRYRVDLAWAEGTRLLRLLGDGHRPYVAAAEEAVRIATALSSPTLSADDLRHQKTALEALARAAEWEPEVQAALEDAARRIGSRTASRTAGALRLIADTLLARGLVHYVYAVSLGQPDRVMVPASEAAARHDYGMGPRNVAANRREWRLPVPDADGMRDWRMSGSLLGMDVGLAGFTLVGVSMRPPPRAPTMVEAERRAFVEALALTEPAALDEADARTIVTAMRRGQARVARMRTVEEAAALAGEARFSPARRTMLSWIVEHDPKQVAAAFAPVELFWLGLDGPLPKGRLDAWGAPAAARTGCLCLSLEAPRPWELLAGRSPMVAAAFPDLKLRIAELLAELDLPARLMVPVLPAATLDFVNTANPPGRHDRRALEAYVRGLRVEQVEQYLALLTTGGPLVPLDDGSPADRGGSADPVSNSRGRTPGSTRADLAGARR